MVLPGTVKPMTACPRLPANAAGVRARARSPGTEFLDAETGRQKPPPKCADAHRDQNPGIEWPGIPAETPYLASYRKRGVCEDWMVGAPRSCGCECGRSSRSSLVAGNGNFICGDGAPKTASKM